MNPPSRRARTWIPALAAAVAFSTAGCRKEEPAPAPATPEAKAVETEVEPPVDPGPADMAKVKAILAKADAMDGANDQGYMTSVAYSPSLGSSIGLGFLANGAERFGETVIAADLIRDNIVEVEIVSPHFLDPQGERLRG